MPWNVLPPRWRSHAAALATVAVLVLVPSAVARPIFSPPADVSGNGASADISALWAQGARLEQRGDNQAAVRFYQDLADQLGDAAAPRALRLAARAALAGRDPETALLLLDRLLARYPGSGEVPDALFTQALARRQAGDCPGALDSLRAFDAAAGPSALGPYPSLQRAACYGDMGNQDGVVAAARAALAVDGGGSRLAKIDAIEREGNALLRLGRKQEALDAFEQALALAGTRAYRAEMLFTTATVARALGNDRLATDRFRAVVVDYPDQARAPGALDALEDMGRAGVVSPYQAGLARLDAKDYRSASDLFQQVGPASPDASAASFNDAVARLRLGQEDAAVQELWGLAEADPSWAGTALLRAGTVLVSDGRVADAESAYRRAAVLDPGDRGAEALVRLGVLRYVAGDPAGALDPLGTALDPVRQAQAATQARALLWQGKALAAVQGPTSPAARDAWTRAMAVAPATYEAFRAQDLLSGVASPLNGGAPADASGLALGSQDQRDLADWLDKAKLTTLSVAAELKADPSLRLADHLVDLGLRDEAGWEVETATSRFATAKDLPRLSAVGGWALERDLPQVALTIGRQEREVAGGTLTPLPKAAWRAAYPAGWGEETFAASAREGVDPFLLLGMVRQESSFNPRAQSGARALGLTQVVPATGRSIAQALGQADTFETSDLFRPSVSLAYGAHYLADQLKSFGGQVLPTLAAYNAGAGPVSSWLAASGGDPDVFVERIAYPETQTYVRVVYENYRIYRWLYGS